MSVKLSLELSNLNLEYSSSCSRLCDPLHGAGGDLRNTRSRGCGGLFGREPERQMRSGGGPIGRGVRVAVQQLWRGLRGLSGQTYLKRHLQRTRVHSNVRPRLWHTFLYWGQLCRQAGNPLPLSGSPGSVSPVSSADCNTRAGRPAPLSNCSVGNRSAEWAEVECSPGFDGGLPQAFLLEAYDARSMRLRLNATKTDSPLFRLTDLSPGSSLRLVLYAANAKGRSEPTVLEDVSLWDAEKRTDSASSAGSESLGILPLLALLLGALLALSSVGLVAALAVRRRRLSPGSSAGDAAPAAHLLGGGTSRPQLFRSARGADVSQQEQQNHACGKKGQTQVQQMPQHQQVDVSRDHFVVSYTVKEVPTEANPVGNGVGAQRERPDILAAKPKSGVERAKRPEVLFRKSDETYTSLADTGQEEKTRRSLPIPGNQIINHATIQQNTANVVPKAQLIIEDSRSNRIRTKAWEDKGTYELNGSLIKEQLMSNHIPESCV
ncbi:hypothetical protein J437_LFUL012498 [Ladona fulva]|uniref:Fibronectin type-III domain-containing protein n=1 Tax=Ladona fulva TaxID=123851 RepID=A0A8K0P1P4_LADFU|nr:hypothetical protein J437_LFUL012498 [Ladona fulva]